MTVTLPSRSSPAAGHAVLDVVGPAPGARVLDVGCGRGDTTIAAARRVGPSGLVIGVDARLTMLEDARARAAGAGLAHVGFVHGDAQSQRFAPLRFDVIVSALGLDVFADAAAGVANLVRALRDGGHLAVAACDDPARVLAALEEAGLESPVAAASGVVTARARPVSSPAASGSRYPPTDAAGVRAPGPRSDGPARG